MWIVDTCVVIDVFENDERFGESSARFLESLLPEGLAICPVTMVELSAAFGGDLGEQKRSLSLAGLSFSEPWTLADTEAAHSAWNDYVTAKRASKTPRRPVADLLIGAHASGRRGLVTRNAGDFRPWFPNLDIRQP
jgi:predicted nucleic acid-binding protein